MRGRWTGFVFALLSILLFTGHRYALAEPAAPKEIDTCEGWASREACERARSLTEKSKEYDKYIPWNSSHGAAANPAPAPELLNGAEPAKSEGATDAADPARAQYQADKRQSEREDGYRTEFVSILVEDGSAKRFLDHDCTDNNKPSGECMNDVSRARKLDQRMQALLAQPGAAEYIKRVQKTDWRPESPARARLVKMPLEATAETPPPPPVASASPILSRRNTKSASIMQTSIKQADDWEKGRPAREAAAKAEKEESDRYWAEYNRRHPPEDQSAAASAQDDSAVTDFVVGMLGVIAQSAIDNNTPQASAPSYTPPPAQQSASSTYSRSQQGSASGPPDDRNIHDPSLAANQCISVSSESAAGRSNFSWFLRNSCGYSVDVLWTGQNGRLTNMGTVGGGADYPMSDNQGAGTRFTACQAGTLRNNYGTGRAWCHR